VTLKTKTVTLTEARNELLRIADELARRPSEVVEVSKRGQRVMTLLSSELYEALLETLDLLSDEATTKQLRQALKEIGAGKGMAWKAAKKRLGLPS
jgi:PHD/YefM family antitoxin component YafN of YafNO toxin-antitoxin module